MVGSNGSHIYKVYRVIDYSLTLARAAGNTFIFCMCLCVCLATIFISQCMVFFCVTEKDPSIRRSVSGDYIARARKGRWKTSEAKKGWRFSVLLSHQQNEEFWSILTVYVYNVGQTKYPKCISRVLRRRTTD